MSQLNCHVFESPVGWIGLIGTTKGLQRLSLKPTLSEVMEDLGDDVEQATSDPDSFAAGQERLARKSSRLWTNNLVRVDR